MREVDVPTLASGCRRCDRRPQLRCITINAFTELIFGVDAFTVDVAE
jgi:hypothetical protein